MKRYDSYKDSGVKWLGEIPSHWEVEPFARHFSYGKGLPITKADLTPDGIAVISYGQVHSKLNKGTTLSDDLVRFVSPNYIESHPQCLLNKGDFVFADTSEDIEGSGNFAFNDYKDRIFAGYHTVVARPNDLSFPKYHAYLFQSLNWKSQIQSLVNGVKVYSIGKGHLKKSYLLIPPLAEQEKIVSYLDNKTSQIDAAIAQQQKMIDLLNERKQIIINNAVTKGLDPNVKMKPSGIDWIGDINENWDLYKLKHLLKSNLMYGANESAESDDLSLPRYIRITDIDEDGNLRSDTFKSLSREKAAPYLLKKGDVLFARSGATAGKSYLFDEDLEACFAGYLIKASLKESLKPKFLAYYTKSGIYDNWKNSIFIQATIPNIGADKYANLMIPLPSMKEQIIIIQQLDKETEKLNNIIRTCKKKISLLQERKQIIINDVVTGKVKVV